MEATQPMFTANPPPDPDFPDEDSEDENSKITYGTLTVVRGREEERVRSLLQPSLGLTNGFSIP